MQIVKYNLSFKLSTQKIVLTGCLLLLFVLSGCSQSGIGPRPAPDLQTVVEAYLQQYQPGPLPRFFQTTYIYDRNGKLLVELFPQGKRTWVPLERISQHLIDATIATEDATFYTNPGVDPRRVAGAIMQNLEAGGIASGASTITMQLARNLFLGTDARYDQSIDRKIMEAGLAQELTQIYTKDEILEMYFNLLNYGNLAYGPEAAADSYFGKSAAELTVSEASLLAGIPQQPANLNPYENLDAAKARQGVVLELMARHGYLSEDEAREVFSEEIVLTGRFFRDDALDEAVEEALQRNPAPHFTQFVIEQLDAKLGAGYAERAGFHIFTSLDPEVQALAQRIVTEKVAELQPRWGLSNAALVAMKPGTAEILAMVGSADYANETIAGQVNVAVRRRQPGSSIKPLFYALAFDKNLISPATVLWDMPIQYTIDKRQNKSYRPHNYDDKFHGPVTARTALANSFNVPMVKLFGAVGVDLMMDRLRAYGIHSLTRENAYYGLSMALGSGEVTLLEMVGAYHTLANEGEYVAPQPILAMVNSQGEALTILEPADPRRVVSPEAAFLTTSILSDNVARSLMFGVNNRLVLSKPAAAKTGTTTDWKDNWTIGYTRYLVAGVWAGNSDGKPTNGSTGASGAAPIWNAFMEAMLADPAMLVKLDAPTDPAAWEFTPGDGIELRRIRCPSGLRCREGGEFFSKEWLDVAEFNDPLFDSAATGRLAAVYITRNGEELRAGACLIPPGSEDVTDENSRSVLTIPSAIGRTGGLMAETEIAKAFIDPDDVAPEQLRLQRQARDQAIAWSNSRSIPVAFGYCENVEETVRRLLGGNIQAVTVRGVGNHNEADGVARETDGQNGADEGEKDGETGSEGAATTENPPPAVPLQYVSYSLHHDSSCAGNYVLGQIVNRDGGLVPGVRVIAVDEWGNRAESVSKDGATDFGRFDFPIYNGNPHNIFINVVDGAGNPISATVTIEHKKGSIVDERCHYIVFKSG